ncbi:hypothetical protein T12_7151 [Trichinella patagoniensis]|uniref:Uncharacterized protein n=1 Tax=Trichinella patagoniensis TaxID=990121 RepID=A0A0V0Z385_9BILA|nr:hypothetical protein T12_7151 [Trichinella patagoniensis]
MRRAPGSEGDPSDVKVTKFHASVRIPAVTQKLITGFVELFSDCFMEYDEI